MTSMLFRYIFPWKMYGPTIELIWIPFKQGCFVASLSEIGPYLLLIINVCSVKSSIWYA